MQVVLFIIFLLLPLIATQFALNAMFKNVEVDKMRDRMKRFEANTYRILQAKLRSINSSLEAIGLTLTAQEIRMNYHKAQIVNLGGTPKDFDLNLNKERLERKFMSGEDEPTFLKWTNEDVINSVDLIETHLQMLGFIQAKDWESLELLFRTKGDILPKLAFSILDRYSPTEAEAQLTIKELQNDLKIEIERI